MKNNKGQALVEFIIVLPILLLLIISIVDFGNIISKKNKLENDLDTIVSMYKEGDYASINTYVSDKDIKVNYKEKEKFLNITLTKNVRVMSPILNLAFGQSYEISTEKSIYNE